MLETLFLNHGRCAISQGKILFFSGSPFKGLLWILWQEITYLEQGDVLTSFATHTCRCVRSQLTQRKTTFPHCGEDVDLRSKAESGAVWVVDSLSPLVHLLNSRLFQFYQFYLIWGMWAIKEANDQKKKKYQTDFFF